VGPSHDRESASAIPLPTGLAERPPSQTTQPANASGPTGPDRRAGQRGYGALDVLVALAVVAVVTAATVPVVRGTLRTYQRNGAAREVLAAIRDAQSLAVMRGEIFGLHWGGDAGVNGAPGEYRIVRDTTGSCGLPSKAAPEDGTNVIRDWIDISSAFSGTSIESIRDSANHALGAVMFDSKGASLNTCSSVSFPVRVTVADAEGATRVIEIRAAGGTRLL
jgi:type II secretory pathway pseudopilin PulG